MCILSLLSEKELEYFTFQARQNFMHDQYKIRAEFAQKEQKITELYSKLAQERNEKMQAIEAKLAAEQREVAALAEIMQLKTLLAITAGIPNYSFSNHTTTISPCSVS